MSQGRLTTGKKPHVIQNVAGEEEAQEESGSLPVYSKEEEETVLWKRMPKKNLLQDRTTRTGKVHIRSPKDRNEQLNNKKKVSRHYRRNRRRQVTEKSADKSETVFSSRVEGQPSKSYSFRSRSKMVSYVPQQEEEAEKSWSEGSSVEDWLPEEEGYDAEEEEDPDEMEVEKNEETEREEESEAGARREQAGPQRKNPKKTVRSYPCPECSRKFNNSSNMRKHLRIHKGERLYGCHACGKSYTDPSNLAHHQRKHTGERPYLCPTCPKAFSMKTNLDIHIRQHLGIRPFSCLQCGSTFYSRTRLVYHMKRHDRRPISVRCEDCDKTFSSQKQFYKHRRRHRNLVCEDCGEIFAFKYKYKFHLSLHKTCRQCGVRYMGMHLCREQVQSSASVPRGAVADQTVDAAAHARGRKQPGPTGAERPSVSVNILLPTDGQVRLSNPARATCLKEISRVAQKSVRASQQTKSLASVSLPVLESRGAKPSTLSQKPPQFKPPGVLLQNVPSAQPVTSSPTVAKPSAQIPASLCPSGPATNLPHTQALAAFSISSAASPVIILLTDSHGRLLTVTAPLGPVQPSGSSPVTEAANNGKTSMNPSTLPLDPKIPNEKSAPSIPAQICATGQTESVEKHRCTKLPQVPTGLCYPYTRHPEDPCQESIPPHSLKEQGNELDKQLEEVEREIKAIVEFWEHSFVDGKEDASPESPWITCSTKETDLELQPNPIKALSEFVDKFIKEQAAVLHIGKTRIVVDSDPEIISVYQPPPSTSKTPSVSVKVKQPELISVYQPPPSTSKTPSVSVKVKQPEKRNKRAFDDTNNISLKGVFDSRGRLIPSAEALASLPQGGWTIRKKIYVNQRIAENH
ncbi:RE1-silencing transcription factor-like isoform X3 [Sphaerodactylus townsendi]|uniref:RE1-silencing transcription factor-like isoform X2 n=1 Tax=Sphaerodactylus townsendi TaxID=933632 RepID=UPI002026816D|nr:RE1-silencing transcription factor-like isoform X2 [Sphaerodactylus townsendi]XP_048355297.1 RE1-silencing transcription factor-like isoform X3 [Sphaerodactylus townsendi]